MGCFRRIGTTTKEYELQAAKSEAQVPVKPRAIGNNKALAKGRSQTPVDASTPKSLKKGIKKASPDELAFEND